MNNPKSIENLPFLHHFFINMYKVSERFFAAKYLPEVKLQAFLFEKAIKRLILVYKNENSKFEGL